MAAGGLSLKFILQVVDQATPAIQKVKAELASLGPAAAGVSAGTDKASQSMTNLGTASTTTSGKVKGFTTEVDKTSTSAKRAAPIIAGHAQGYDLTGRSAQSATQPVAGFGSEIQKQVPIFNRNLSATEGLSSGYGALGKATKGVTGGLNQTNTIATKTASSMDEFSTSTQKASKNTIGMASNLRGMIIPMVGMGSAIIEAVGMYQAYQDVSKKVAEAQKHVNEAVARYGKDSKEAKQATDELKDAQRGLGFILRNTIQSISDIGIFVALMANSFLKLRGNTAAATVATEANTVANAKNAVSLTAVGTASNTTGGALTRLTGVLRGIPLALGPIGIAFAVIGAAVAAFTALYSQNIGGIRDKTNDFGDAVGDAIPILRPFGDLLVGVAGKLGLTGESAQQTEKHMRDATAGFQDMGSLWEQTVTKLQAGFNKWTDAVGKGAALVGKTFTDIFTNIGKTFASWISEFGARLQNGFNNVFAPIIPIAEDVAKGIGDALSSFINWVTGPATDAILSALGLDRATLEKAAADTGKALGEAFSNAVKAASAVGEAILAGAKATQQPGASGNIPKPEEGKGIFGLEEPQQTTFMGQPEALPFQKGLQSRFAGHRITPTRVPSPQRVEDLGIAPTNLGTDVTTGLSALSSPKTIQGVRFLNKEIDAYGAKIAKTTAIDKALTGAVNAGTNANKEALSMWNELTNNGTNPAATAHANLEDIMTLLPDDMKLSEAATERFKEAQQAATRVLDNGGTAAEANAAAQNVLAGAFGTSTQKAKDHETVLQKASKANKDLATTVSETSKAAKDGTLATQMQTQGTLEAKAALQSYAGDLVKATEFNKFYGAAVDTAGFKQIAFATGVEQQKAALTDSKVALAESSGALSEYNAQIASGEPQQIAYAQAVVDTERALNDTDVAIAATQGSLDTMNKALATGRPQRQAFIQGMQDSAKALQDTAIGSAHTAGEIEHLSQALKTTNGINTLFTKGVVDTEKAFWDSVAALAETQGSLQRYNQLLAEGKIQSVAYAQGQHEIISAFQQMEAETAKLEGEIEAYNELLKTGQATQDSFNLGLRQGMADAQGWWTELKKADGAAIGTIAGLRQMADIMNIQLPPGIQMSAEQLKQFIGVMSGSTTAVEEFIGKLQEGVTSLREGLTVGLDDLADDVEDKVDDMADNWEETFGTEMPDSVRRANEQIATDQSWAAAATAGKTQLLNVINDPEAFSEAFGSIMEGLEDKIPEMSGKSRAAAEAVLTAYRNVAQDPHNVKMWQNLETAITNLENVNKTLDLAAPFEAGKESAVKYSTEIDNIVKKIVAAKPELARFKDDIAGLAANAPGTAAGILKPPAPTKVGPIPKEFGTQPMAAAPIDTAAMTTALDTLLKHATDVFNQLALLPKHLVEVWPTQFQAAVTAIGVPMATLLTASINTFNQLALMPQYIAAIWPTHFTAAVAAIGVPMATLLVATINTMNLVGASAALVTVAWTTNFNQAYSNVLGILALLLTDMTAFTTTVGTLIAQIPVFFTTHFNTSYQNALGVLAQLLTDITTFTTGVNTALSGIAVAFTTHFNRGTENAAGKITQLESHVKSKFASITSTVTKIAEVFTSSFNKGTENAAGKINQLEQHIATKTASMISHIEKVASAIEKIGTSATNAKGKVDQLASAINNLKDKTVTITTRHVSTGGGFQHGGAFISTKSDRIGGHNISEFNKPELVTVTPLSNPNKSQDRSVRLNARTNKPDSRQPVVMDTTIPQSAPSRAPRLTIKGEIKASFTLPDGRKLAREIIPFELENIDAYYV